MEIKKTIKNFYLTIKWRFSAFIISFLNIDIYSKSTILDIKNLKKSLILVPHADDEWIGCSQILKNSKNKTVYYLNFLGKNYSAENEITRLNELKNLQKEIGFQLVISDDRKNHDDLKKLIDNNNFSEIFIPSPIDWHPEHILVNNIFKNIYSLIENKDFSMFFYEVSVPMPSKIEKKFLPMSKKEVKEKQNIFKKHYPSQKNIPIERLTLQNRLSRGNTNYFAIETYGKIEISSWHKLLQYIDLNFEKEFQPMSHIIDYPIKIRKYTNTLYNNFLKFLNNNHH